jgi:hypothetical protein
MTVAIEVGHRAGFVSATVDQAALEWDLGGPGSGPGREYREQRGAPSIDRESDHVTD